MINTISFEVETEIYKGPFDLLLKGIEQGEIDIYQVSISQIVSAYFKYWKEVLADLIMAGDFVYMAALLLEMKSRSLLPAKEEIVLPDEGLREVEDSLLAHIQEYEIYKHLAKTLHDRKEVFSRAYGRHEGEPQEKEIELKDVSLQDLVLAFKKVYDDAAKRDSVVSIQAEEITIEQRIHEIKQMVAGRKDGIPFVDIFIRKTRLEVVVTFLAVLELAKQRCIQIVQSRRFGSILIFAREVYDGYTDEHGTEYYTDGYGDNTGSTGEQPPDPGQQP